MLGLQHQTPGLILPPSLIYPEKKAIVPTMHGVAASSRFKGGEEDPIGPANSLRSEVNSTVFYVDATDIDSYPGTGQTWSNLIQNPNDGEVQTAYDFVFGTTVGANASDPTFNGTAGDQAAYMSFDGGDNFTIASSVNTAFLNACAVTTGGADFWCAAAVYFAVSTSSQAMMGTSNMSGNGFQFYIIAFNNARLGQRQNSVSQQAESTATAPDTTPCIMIASHSHSLNLTRFWINSRTGQELAHTFATGVNVGSDLTLGAGAGGSDLLAGARMYAAAMGNEFLDNTKAGLIFDFLNDKHGRTYA